MKLKIVNLKVFSEVKTSALSSLLDIFMPGV